MKKRKRRKKFTPHHFIHSNLMFISSFFDLLYKDKLEHAIIRRCDTCMYKINVGRFNIILKGGGASPCYSILCYETLSMLRLCLTFTRSCRSDDRYPGGCLSLKCCITLCIMLQFFCASHGRLFVLQCFT